MSRCIACAFTSGYEEGAKAIAPASASGDGFALGIGVGLILASEPQREHVIAALCEEHRTLTGQSAAVVAAVIA